jgi:hypothetical protein
MIIYLRHPKYREGRVGEYDSENKKVSIELKRKIEFNYPLGKGVDVEIKSVEVDRKQFYSDNPQYAGKDIGKLRGKSARFEIGILELMLMREVNKKSGRL